MDKRLMLVMFASLASGCLSPGPKYYVHQNKTQEEYRKERFDCENEARKVDALPASFKMNAFDAYIDKCLREKYGWAPQPK